MQIFGLDFTSAPSRRKPITRLIGGSTENILRVDHQLKLASLNEIVDPEMLSSS